MVSRAEISRSEHLDSIAWAVALEGIGALLMFDEVSSPQDGVMIARSLRDLAFKARRVLDSADEDEAREVCRAIEGLEREIEPGSAADLGLWLANLRRRVERRLPTIA